MLYRHDTLNSKRATNPASSEGRESIAWSDKPTGLGLVRSGNHLFGSHSTWVPGGCRLQPCADASTRRIGPEPRWSCASGFMAVAGCCRAWWRDGRQKLRCWSSRSDFTNSYDAMNTSLRRNLNFLPCIPSSPPPFAVTATSVIHRAHCRCDGTCRDAGARLTFAGISHPKAGCSQPHSQTTLIIASGRMSITLPVPMVKRLTSR